MTAAVDPTRTMSPDEVVASYVSSKLRFAGYTKEEADEIAEHRIDSELAIHALTCCKGRLESSHAALYLLGLRDEL